MVPVEVLEELISKRAARWCTALAAMLPPSSENT
jgi:hypothetical protein